MKISTYIIGALAAVSVASGLICLKAANHIRAGKRHGKPSTFRDLYEDNKVDYNLSRVERYVIQHLRNSADTYTQFIDWSKFRDLYDDNAPVGGDKYV